MELCFSSDLPLGDGGVAWQHQYLLMVIGHIIRDREYKVLLIKGLLDLIHICRVIGSRK